VPARNLVGIPAGTPLIAQKGISAPQGSGSACGAAARFFDNPPAGRAMNKQPRLVAAHGKSSSRTR
jgi:hypothetical protein